MFLSSLARFYENCQEKERSTLFTNHTLLETTTLLERKIFNEVLGFEVLEPWSDYEWRNRDNFSPPRILALKSRYTSVFAFHPHWNAATAASIDPATSSALLKRETIIATAVKGITHCCDDRQAGLDNFFVNPNNFPSGKRQARMCFLFVCVFLCDYTVGLVVTAKKDALKGTGDDDPVKK